MTSLDPAKHLIGSLDPAKDAIGYTRTSSAANVGPDKDSETRQRKAIEAYAWREGFRIIGWFADPAVSGTDPIDARPGFAAALERMTGNGVRVIIVETANRFARDLIVQETGYKRLAAEGITLIAADSPEQFTDDTPTARLIRQILGAVAQFDKAMTVAKLRGARERKRRATGRKVEGRKSYAERDPDMTALAKELRHDGKSLRQISSALAKQGYTDKRDQPYSAAAVRSMVGAERVASLMEELRASLERELASPQSELEAKGSATMPQEGPQKPKAAKKVTRR
jgi:DNA invertase Pin-like site-specific DNA recombinase